MNVRNWHNISLRDYYKIKELITEPDDYTVFNVLDLLYDIDSTSMTLNELSTYNNSLEFLNTEVPKQDPPKHLSVNGHEYDVMLDLTKVNVAQFVDYQNFLKNNPKFEELLSVFIIPTGHKYNDGYDIEQVKEDILSVDFASINAITFFFEKEFELLLSIFQLYLTQEIMKMKLPKNQKKELIRQLNEMDLSGEFCRTFSAMLKKQEQLSIVSLKNQ